MGGLMGLNPYFNSWPTAQDIKLSGQLENWIEFIMNTNDLDQLLTEKEAAKLICYTPRALQNWRVRGGGPKYIKVSARSVRYQRRDVLDWINDRKRANTSQQFG